MKLVTFNSEFTKNKQYTFKIKNFNKKIKNYIHNRLNICIMKNVETWRLFLQFCFLVSEEVENAVREGNTTQRENTFFNL